MFAQASSIAEKFTRPVIFAYQTLDGRLQSSVGALIVLNEEGWVATALHLVTAAQDLASRKANYDDIERKRLVIRDSDEKMSDSERQKRVKRIKHAGDAVQRYAATWGVPGSQLVEVTAIPEADLAIGRLDPFDPASIPAYPVLKDPAQGLACGTSLCRLGYPFAESKLSLLADGSFEIDRTPPLFAIEGIYSRNIHVGLHPNGYEIAFLETSSPGLRGQSGGPIYDRHGTIWAVQSQTRHYPLGFSPAVPNGKVGQVEHQFLNVGWGVHPATLVGLLRERGIAHTLSAY